MTRSAPKTLPKQALQAELEPGSFNAAAGTVRVVWSTGARVRFSDWDGEYDLTLGLKPENVDLSFARQGAPVLDAHGSYSVAGVVGVVEQIAVDGARGTATLRFSKRPEVAPIVQDVADGVLRFVSVGTKLRKLRDITAKDETVPHYFAELHEPLEISLAPIPRDRGAVMQSQAESERFPVEIRKDPTMPEPTILDTTTQGEQPDAATLAERQRGAEIRKCVKLARLGDDVAESFIERGTPLDEVRRVVLDRLAAQSDATASRSGCNLFNETDHSAQFAIVAGEALAARNGGPAASRAAEDYYGWPFARLAEECLRRNGIRPSSLSPDRVINQALHTTSDFPAILANAFDKRLRTAYNAAFGGVQSLARQSSAKDFRAKLSIQFGEAPNLLLVNEHGEFTRGTMAEASEQYSVVTYGRVFGLSRQAMVNDDLSAFDRIPQQLATGARELERRTLVARVTANPVMADTKAIFHADHGNLAASGAAISVDTLTAARKALRLQTGVDGATIIDMRPTSLLVPASLETKAEQVLATLAAATVGEVNPFGGKLELVVEPRLDAASATAWYVVAKEAEGLEYSYLEGQEGPFLDSRVGFDVDGIEFKVRLDFGAGWVDHRSWFKNAGA